MPSLTGGRTYSYRADQGNLEAWQVNGAFHHLGSDRVRSLFRQCSLLTRELPVKDGRCFHFTEFMVKKCELLEAEGARPPCAMRVVHTVTGIPE